MRERIPIPQEGGLLVRLMSARQQETTEIVALANLGDGLAEAARWLLEEGTDDARENLAGAVAKWEVER